MARYPLQTMTAQGNTETDTTKGRVIYDTESFVSFFFEMGRGCVNYKIICPLVIFSISIYAFFTIWGQDPHILQDSQQHKHKQNAHYTKFTSILNGCVCVVWVEVRMMLMMSTRVSLLIQSHTENRFPRERTWNECFRI